MIPTHAAARWLCSPLGNYYCYTHTHTDTYTRELGPPNDIKFFRRRWFFFLLLFRNERQKYDETSFIHIYTDAYVAF